MKSNTKKKIQKVFEQALFQAEKQNPILFLHFTKPIIEEIRKDIEHILKSEKL